MDLKEIMSVSGHSGLFKFISQGRNGIIVESFTDKKRMFVSASQKVSSLSDIAIFTDGDEIPLKDVLKNIHDQNPGKPAPDAKSTPEELRKFMEGILPNYDRNRVYVSDMKKLVAWYNTLLELHLLSFDDEKAEDKTTEEEVASVKEEKPAKTEKTTAKKPAAKKSTSKKE